MSRIIWLMRNNPFSVTCHKPIIRCYPRTKKWIWSWIQNRLSTSILSKRFRVRIWFQTNCQTTRWKTSMSNNTIWYWNWIWCFRKNLDWWALNYWNISYKTLFNFCFIYQKRSRFSMLIFHKLLTDCKLQLRYHIN